MTVSLAPYVPFLKLEIDKSYAYFSDSSQHIKCEICGELAIMRHFSAYSCNACAAFFRRTVASQKTYFRRRGINCHMTSGLSKFN